MSEKLGKAEMNCLREIAGSNGKVESRIPQNSLAKLLKFGLVETRNMMTLWITWKGRQWLAVVAPELGQPDCIKPVRYALFADSGSEMCAEHH